MCADGGIDKERKLVTLYSPGICGVRADTLRAWSMVAMVLVVAVNTARVREKKRKSCSVRGYAGGQAVGVDALGRRMTR